MVKRVVLWGATGQAKVLRECLEQLGFTVAAVFDNRLNVESPFSDVALGIGRDGLIAWRARQDPTESFGFLVAVGGGRGRERLALQEWLSEEELFPMTVTHPRAFVANGARIGLGSQVLAMASVAVDVVVGTACIINTAASVDHECQLGDGVHVGPGAHLAGCVVVEDGATVYTGAIVAPRITVGADAVVGAGAVVLADVPERMLVVGSPARVVRPVTSTPAELKH